MEHRGNAKFRRYMQVIFGVALVAFMIAWAFNQGARDGKEHRVDHSAARP